jgi:hypothetical protein
MGSKRWNQESQEIVSTNNKLLRQAILPLPTDRRTSLNKGMELTLSLSFIRRPLSIHGTYYRVGRPQLAKTFLVAPLIIKILLVNLHWLIWVRKLLRVSIISPVFLQLSLEI